MFIEFYWTLAKYLARRLSKHGKRDFMLGLAFAFCTGTGDFILRDKEWVKAIIVALVGLVLWLWAMAVCHFVKAPVQIHADKETEEKARAEGKQVGWAGIGIIAFLLVVPLGAGWWWCSGRSIEFERKESLRRRTTSIANDVRHYLEDRAVQHPPYANANAVEPTADQKRQLEVDDKYDKETLRFYSDNYLKTMLAVVAEYKAKGVNIGFLDTGLSPVALPWYANIPGMESMSDKECMDNLCKFTELAYHVDESDNRITLP